MTDFDGPEVKALMREIEDSDNAREGRDEDWPYSPEYYWGLRVAAMYALGKK